MLEAGVNEYRAADSAIQHLTVEVTTVTDFLEGIEGYVPEQDIIFIVVSERELSRRKEKVGDREPCRSLHSAQLALGTHPKLRVYLIDATGTSAFSAVDLGAALGSGAAGVIHDRGLMIGRVVGAIIEHQQPKRKYHTLLLIGQSADSIQALQNMLKEWEEDPLVEEGVSVVACWRTAVALAQLERLDPLFVAGSQPFSYSKLAESLNLAEHVTGFHYTPDELRRIISTLSRRWLGNEHQEYARVQLPTHARKQGLPSSPPALLGMSGEETARRLCQALLQLAVINPGEQVGMPYKIIRLEKQIVVRTIKRFQRFKQGEDNARPHS